MSNPLATLNQQIVSDIDSLADFWKAAAAEGGQPERAPAKRKRTPRRRSKTPPPAANL